MKHFLLLGLLATSFIGASAQLNIVSHDKTSGNQEAPLKAKSVYAIKSLPENFIANEKGKIRTASKETELAPPTVKAAAKSTLRDGFVLYENFDGWDSSMDWVPKGWTKEHKGECDVNGSWFAGSYEYGIPCRPADGLYFYGIGYAEDEIQDEWLITPEVEISENMVLTYWLYLRPFYLYDYNKLGNRITTFTLQIMVKPEGGDWVAIKDYAEDYKDYDDFELYNIVIQMTSSTDMYKQTVSLADFAGKKVQVAFRYYGLNGDAVFVDGIGISLPEIENVSYSQPENTLFWGLSNDPYMSGMNNDIAFYPVCAPLKWINNRNSDSDITYSWKYQITETMEDQFSNNPNELEVTYYPDYSSPMTLKNNFYYPPTLLANAPGKAAGFYQAPYWFLQAGGKPEIEMDDEKFEVSLLPFPINQTDWNIFDVRDGKLGAYSVPVFGHNEFTNDYWLNYYLNDAEKLPGNYAKLQGIANLFWPSKEAPLVVNGVNVQGWGRFWDEAELKLSIYALPATGNGNVTSDFTKFKKVGEATLSGRDVQSMSGGKDKDYQFLAFQFDEPVSVQGSDEYPAFAFMFEGFNSDQTDYFSPGQSQKPGPFGNTMGYMLHEIDLTGQEGGLSKHYEFEKMRYTEEGKERIPTGGFLIGLVAEYPWLYSDTEKITLGINDNKASVTLYSYYSAADLVVTPPQGLIATISEEDDYNVCTVTLERIEGEPVIIDSEVVIKGKGVEVEIPVVAAGTVNSVDEIITNDGVVEAVYDLSGRKVSSPEAGVYIVKSSNGKVRKVIIK